MVPQIFFNDVHIGGANDLIVQLKNWEKHEKEASDDYPLLSHYETCIAAAPDPSDLRLRLCSRDVLLRDEPILTKNERRFVLFPIRDEEVRDLSL